MNDRFIPDGDSEFALMARNFAAGIVKDPGLYHFSADEAQEIMAKVGAFHEARAANDHKHTSCKATRMRKDAARLAAEIVIRDAGNRIRSNRQIKAVDKMAIRVKERPTRLRRRECPQTPPVLLFAGPTPAANAIEGKHIIKFFDDWGKQSLAKPDGAVRLELFVDLVPPEEPIPTWPGERWGGRMWYLGSYSRSPAEVNYPRADQLMRVVYWGRWAGGNCDTGPFSLTLATRVEGFDRPMQMLGAGPAAKRITQTVIITSIRPQLPESIEIMQPGRDPGAKLLGSDVADAA